MELGFLATSNKYLCVCGENAHCLPAWKLFVISQYYNRLASVVILLSKQQNLSTHKLHWLLSAGHHHAFKDVSNCYHIF